MYDKRYFTEIESKEVEQANNLCDIICKIYDPKIVGDVGCATGLYLVPFHVKGTETIGWDNAEYAVGEKRVPTVVDADITKKLPKQRVDLAICLEVLEHIESGLSKPVIENITKLSDVIIFSAAQVGQGGTGHVNCRPREYWEGAFMMQGFKRDIEAEHKIREHVTKGKHAGWFRRNLQVFVKYERNT